MTTVQQTKKISIALLLGLISFAAMIIFFNMQQSLMVAIIVLMVTLWTNEGLPLAVVSLLPIVLFPSAGVLSTKEAAVNYANPIIYLFLGGFLIAIAVEKTGLHKIIANKMLGLFPSSARGIIFALIITSGLLSSVLSNTTTTLLLLPIALFLTEDVKLKMRLALGIAYGASIGGILTPIGTPPNLIFMGIMEEFGMEAIPFVQWMYMVSPIVFIMFIVVGFIMSIGLKDVHIETDLSTEPLNSEQKKVLYLIGGLIVTLLVNAPIKPYYNGLGLSEPGILLAAGLLLFMPPFSILDWMKDKENISLIASCFFLVQVLLSLLHLQKQVWLLRSHHTLLASLLCQYCSFYSSSLPWSPSPQRSPLTQHSSLSCFPSSSRWQNKQVLMLHSS